METVNAYRKAAKALFGANEAEVAHYIRSPEDDPGQWAPNSLAVIYLEPYGFREDTGIIPHMLDCYGNGFENCIRLAESAGVGYVEYINAAVAAVYPA